MNECRETLAKGLQDLLETRKSPARLVDAAKMVAPLGVPWFVVAYAMNEFEARKEEYPQAELGDNFLCLLETTAGYMGHEIKIL
jgi:hypothetical protein